MGRCPKSQLLFFLDAQKANSASFRPVIAGSESASALLDTDTG
jgi:hypothetical protein